MVRLRSDHTVRLVASGSIYFLFDCLLSFWAVFVAVVVVVLVVCVRACVRTCACVRA